MKRIYILGVNGNARDVLETIALVRTVDPNFPEPGGFLDDRLAPGTLVQGVPVRGSIETASKIVDACFVNAIGSPESYALKPAIIKKAGVPLSSFLSVIHPSAVISSSAQIGQGSVILSNTSIGSGVKIGNHVMVLQNCIVSHDSQIGDYSVLATGVCLSGDVHVEPGAYLGSHCCIRGGGNVGAGSLVGMGSVVVKDIPAGQVWCGNPARYLRHTRNS